MYLLLLIIFGVVIAWSAVLTVCGAFLLTRGAIRSMSSSDDGYRTGITWFAILIAILLLGWALETHGIELPRGD